MLAKGKIIQSESGHNFRVDQFISSGGQAEVYKVSNIKTNEKNVLKIFHRKFDKKVILLRTRFLLENKLDKLSPVLCGPKDLVNHKDMIGHISLFIEAKPLEEFLIKPDTNLHDNIQIAIALVHAIDCIHELQIAHGDIHADNVLIIKQGGIYKVYLIDHDNFNAPGIPEPQMIGHNLYMAPELRRALARSDPAVPNLFTDRFSLGVIMHELLLFKHVAAGSDGNEQQFQKAMCSGQWIHDPAGAEHLTSNPGGYPPEILNTDLARLFRQALSLDTKTRPTAKKWSKALYAAFDNTAICPGCNGPCLIETSKTICPNCGKPFPILKLQLSNGDVIPLDTGAIPIGRNNLGGSRKVSQRHAIFRRIGPETFIESCGRNGTYRWRNKHWIRLPDEKPILVQKNDRLKFADLEVILKESR